MIVFVVLLLASEKWTCQFQLPLLIVQERWQFFLTQNVHHFPSLYFLMPLVSSKVYFHWQRTMTVARQNEGRYTIEIRKRYMSKLSENNAS